MERFLFLIDLIHLFFQSIHLTLYVIDVGKEFLLLFFGFPLLAVLLNLESFSGHFQHLHGTSQINGTVSRSLIACHIVLNFPHQILSCNTL